jgi:Cu/Ag efflux pump CusA
MMRWIVGSSLRNRSLVVMIAAAVMLVGVFQVRNMPVDVLPEFAPPHVEIQTEALGLSAEEVAQMITVPLEQDLLNGVAWVDTIRSDSIPGLSSITITFRPGTDLMRARQMVGERLTQAFALPHVSKPPTMLQPLSSTGRVMMIGLSSKSLSAIELSVLARWTISPRLMGVPGVANVAIWGQRDRQLQVQVDPQRLQDAGVSLLQVLETTGNAMWVSSLSFVEASTPGTGGFIETNNQRLGIRHIFPISSPEGLAQVPIEDSTLRLGQVADVVEDHQPLIGDAVTGDGPGLLLVVEKFPAANTLAVTRGVEQALAELRPGLPGVAVDAAIFRPATFIDLALANLTRSLLLGCLLVVAVLGAFLFEWRTAAISLVAIPLSLAAGALVLALRGATLNTMVLAGFVIAVGVVVDDAIIDVEHIARRLEQRRLEGSLQQAAAVILEASLEVRSAIVYATLIGLLALVPVFFVGGVSGSFFQPLALAYGLAVLASMAAALTVTPALSLLLGRGARRASPLAGWLQRGYARALAPVVRRPRLSYAALGALVLAGLAVLPFLKSSPLPSFKEPDVLVHLVGAPSTSQPAMSRIVARASDELRSIPGVRHVGAHVGRAVMSDRVVDVNSGELWVGIDPAAGYDATLAAVKRVVNGYPGLHGTVQSYLQERSNQVAAGAVAGVDSAITVRVYGENPAVLGSAAGDVKRALADVSGIVDPVVKLPVEEPTLQVEVDLAAAQRYGLKPGDVRRAAATLLSGIQAGSLFEEQKVFDVVVWGTPATRSSLSSVRDLLLDTPGGERVRLGDVARVRVAAAPTVIRHDASKSYLDVRASVRGRALGAVASDVERRLQSLALPLE